MIRLICREVDTGAAVHIGGPVVVNYRTFNIEAPELEAWLLEAQNPQWSIDRTIEGAELAALDAEEGRE